MPATRGAYLFRDGELQRLTRDHTLAQTMIDAGVAVEGSPEERRRRNILTNCIGGPDLALEVDVDHHRLTHRRPAPALHGWTDQAPRGSGDRHAARAPRRPRMTPAGPWSTWPWSAGGRDNVTVVIGRFAFPGPAEEFPVD